MSSSPAHVAKRGRPRKPPPLTKMNCKRFLSYAHETKLELQLLNDDTNTKVQLQAPRRTKSGKCGWAFSSKLPLVIDGEEVVCQLSGTLHAIRSDHWPLTSEGAEAEVDSGLITTR